MGPNPCSVFTSWETLGQSPASAPVFPSPVTPVSNYGLPTWPSTKGHWLAKDILFLGDRNAGVPEGCGIALKRQPPCQERHPSLDVPPALPGLVEGVGKQKQPQDSLCPQGLPWPSLRREAASWAWAVRKWR